MQNRNHNQVQEEGSDLQCFAYEDFVLNSDNVNSHIHDVTNGHVSPDCQEPFVNWNSSSVNPYTDVADIRVNPHSPKQHFMRDFLTEDEIFEGLPNIDPPQSILSYEHLSSELGDKDLQRDDAVVVSKEEFKRRPGKNEVHNQLERNRRNAIKNKIHKLGELLPSCTKTDQASILTDAVEHIKALLCQRQMLSMTWYSMWLAHLAGLQNNMTQQIVPKFMPQMKMDINGIDMANMFGGENGLQFPLPNLPVFPQLRLPLPPPPPSPTALIAAQVKPPTNATCNTASVVGQLQPMPYTSNLGNQGEYSTSQFNEREKRDHNENAPILGEEYTEMASGTM